MMNLALIHKSLFVRSTLHISLISPNDPVRNRNRVFITSISQVKPLKPHIFILICLAFEKMSLQVWKIHHCYSPEGQKTKSNNILNPGAWNQTFLLRVFMAVRGIWSHISIRILFMLIMDWHSMNFWSCRAEAFSMRWFMCLI